MSKLRIPVADLYACGMVVLNLLTPCLNSVPHTYQPLAHACKCLQMGDPAVWHSGSCSGDLNREFLSSIFPYPHIPYGFITLASRDPIRS